MDPQTLDDRSPYVPAASSCIRPPSRRGASGAEAYAFVDWLRGRGPALVADAAARPARPLRLARTRPSRRSRPGPGCSRSRARAVSKAEELDFRERNAAWIEDWVALRRARSARRPGPLRPRVGRAAPLRGRARRAADRRRADLRRARQRRPSRAPGALPGRRRRRHAARRVHRQGPAVGQPALRLAGAAAARLPLVDRAPAAHVRPLRPRPRRPLPRLRLLLVGARAGAPRAVRALEARAGPRGLRRRGGRARASCR